MKRATIEELSILCAEDKNTHLGSGGVSGLIKLHNNLMQKGMDSFLASYLLEHAVIIDLHNGYQGYPEMVVTAHAREIAGIMFFLMSFLAGKTAGMSNTTSVVVKGESCFQFTIDWH
jgi:hypothetical protein